MKRFVFLSGFLASLVTLILIAIPAQSASDISHHPRIGEGTYYSTNWSGYAIATDTGGVTDVSGSWTVPEVQSGKGKNYSSAWVGIDGDNSNSVEQIGTEQDYTHGGASYYAWYEMYPQYPVNLDTAKYPVAPGDVMTAEVKYDSKSDQFILTLSDSTQKWSYSTTQPDSSFQRSSAEWIMEAPWMGTVLPLANFGTIYFSRSKATINGKPVTITDSNSDKLIMVTNNGIIKALPSGAAAGSFNVTWEHK